MLARVKVGTDDKKNAAEERPADDEGKASRRGFMGGTGTAVVAGGLIASYGSFAAISARFAYPRPSKLVRLFVADLASFAKGHSTHYLTHEGAKVTITRHGMSGSAADFIALSSVCPHLGCQVQWEHDKQRFFCPCHNGTFDPQGNPTGGPPKAANQLLSRFTLAVEAGLLFIELPEEELA